MSALADRHLGEAFVRLRLRLGQLPPEYLRLPALIHEGLTQQMPDYAAAVWRLEGLLGRELSGALDEAACVAAYAALGLPGKVEKAKGVPYNFSGEGIEVAPTKEIRLNAFSYLLLEEIRRVNRPAGSR